MIKPPAKSETYPAICVNCLALRHLAKGNTPCKCGHRSAIWIYPRDDETMEQAVTRSRARITAELELAR